MIRDVVLPPCSDITIPVVVDRTSVLQDFWVRGVETDQLKVVTQPLRDIAVQSGRGEQVKAMVTFVNPTTQAVDLAIEDLDLDVGPPDPPRKSPT